LVTENPQAPQNRLVVAISFVSRAPFITDRGQRTVFEPFDAADI
jgi:hypothetical protein